ncbi:lysophospholipase-like protein [Phanerochaete sordida]|uniref:Lysophospholipase-like protein n=1 Tax=Phanerochaete sordida TaxID=48140 RepID=A0A9P3LJ52_9APHY|nr:lysophospholipase-like protein [Phanerochaete sordida]
MATDSTSTPYVEAWLPGFDGHQFYTRLWPAAQPKAAALYVHGFADHVSRYDHIHSAFAQRGIVMFAYDKRGFGKTALDKEHRSPGASYDKTNLELELSDVEFWLQHLSRERPGLPLFLVGYSASGGLVFNFVTRDHAPPKAETKAMLAGVVGCSPLIYLANPAPGWKRFLATHLSKLAPNMTLAAPMPEELFSRIPEKVEALKRDRLRRPEGTLKGLHDMIASAEQLLDNDKAKAWPENLPLLVTHGTADEVNSPAKSREFFDKVPVQDKKFLSYDGAYHDLFNEADGIAERSLEDVISWIEVHVPT